MERHELINKYEKRLQKENPARIEQLYCEIIRDLFDLEQTKVEVPEFVAEWIEKSKTKGKGLLTALSYTPGGVNRWVDNSDNQETFALAWMFGYTIKKEPRYFVEIKATKHCFAIDGKGKIFFSLAYKSPFTKKELEEKGFGWVFNCTGIELLEVE
jgi:hypothetical protein|nr:MAG TPA: Protein of unknown function (DUF1642) [Caudoviricetes sp.]